MKWINNQFEHHLLFRRLTIVFMLWFIYDLTVRSFALTYYYVDNQLSSTDIVMVLTAIQVVPLALMGYLFKLYSISKLGGNTGAQTNGTDIITSEKNT